jgi:hypothetical protein
MLYEYHIIKTETLTTIPDFVMALHSFYLVQRELNIHNLSFKEWMLQQAIKQPIYQFLKYMQRLEGRGLQEGQRLPSG